MSTRTVFGYTDALAILATASARPRFTGRVAVGHNTYLTAIDDDAVAVVFWTTAVVTFHADDAIVIDTGGYATATTVLRLNRHTPARYRFYRRQGTVYMDDLRANTTTAVDGPVLLRGSNVDADTLAA